jgi:catechol 2,3-dioxygenase-like lactoylglutathione lyase family enzyme
MTWRAITAFRLVTADPGRLTRFYAALGFSIGQRHAITPVEMALLGIEGAGMRWSMTLGPSRVDLDCFERPGRPYPPDADAASLCFQHLALVTDDASSAWARAERAGALPISRDGPVTLPRAAGGVTAVKFRDPEGHPLELLQFPEPTGQGPPDRAICGIDHSAISVADVAASSMFYESQALTQGKTSLNVGTEQVALDGLDGVAVDVVPLQPRMMPPHLELLGYRHPRGRVFDRAAPNDIAATRVVWGAGRTDLVRDPDGHLHQLEQG